MSSSSKSSLFFPSHPQSGPPYYPFSGGIFGPKSPLDINSNYFNRHSKVRVAVDKFLPQLTSPTIHTFRLSLQFKRCDRDEKNWWSTADSLLRHVCDRDVQEIEVRCNRYMMLQYDFYPDKLPQTNSLPLCIFQNPSLVGLELGGECPCFPLNHNYEGFAFNLPNLKRLSVSLFDCVVLGKLIRSCPSLEDLYFIVPRLDSIELSHVDVSAYNLKRLRMEYYMTGNVVVDAPKLEYLNVKAPSLSISFGSNPIGLREADVTSWGYSPDKSNLMSHLYGVISNVSSLKLQSGQLGAPVLFPHLTHLVLNVNLDHKCKQMIRLLYFCPALETLMFHFVKFLTSDDMSWIPLDPAPNCMLMSVKRIEISVPRWQRYSVLDLHPFLDFAKYLLNSALVLELFTFSMFRDTEQNQEQFFREELYQCQRSSSKCQIDFILKDHKG